MSSLLVTVGVAIGPMIAKYLIKEWLGEGLLPDLVGELTKLAGKMLKEAGEKKIEEVELDKVARAIAKRMKPAFDLAVQDRGDVNKEAVVIWTLDIENKPGQSRGS